MDNHCFSKYPKKSKSRNKCEKTQKDDDSRYIFKRNDNYKIKDLSSYKCSKNEKYAEETKSDNKLYEIKNSIKETIININKAQVKDEEESDINIKGISLNHRSCIIRFISDKKFQTH